VPGVTLNAVATSLEIKIKKGIVKAEGDLDFKGTLGVSKESPVGFKDIRLFFYLNYRCHAGTIRHAAKIDRKILCGLSDVVEEPFR